MSSPGYTALRHRALNPRSWFDLAPDRQRKGLPTPLTALAVAGFTLLVTLNSAGYRYGVSDQAYYIPAVGARLDPTLFPRDRALLEVQSRLTLWDDAFALVERASGLPRPVIFFAGYLLTAGLLAAGALRLGRRVGRTPWTALALLAALSLRHQVAGTAVNTFEGYFHPRVLAVALGVLALSYALDARWSRALGLSAVSALVHPLVGTWFVVWIAAARLWSDGGRRWRTAVIVSAGGAAVAAWMISSGPLAGSLVTMDEAWLSVLGPRAYLFPGEWPWHAWLSHALAVVVIVVVARQRRQRGLDTPEERAVAVGVLALAAVFLASWPLTAARLALAVQLQVPRVLWLVELLATVYLVWWLAEGGRRSHRAARAVALVMLTLATVRGGYVTFVEQQRPLVRLDLPDDAWRDVGRWIATQTPREAHVLVDPDHAWKFGSSLRVVAGRDVFTESVKDAAWAIFRKDVARRVGDRRQALGAFGELTAGHALDLAHRYDLSLLVSERPMPLPLVYSNSRFLVYRLDAAVAPAPDPGRIPPAPARPRRSRPGRLDRAGDRTRSGGATAEFR